VTPGAISQQVKLLEDHLGVRLFERLPRAIRLTPLGHEFFSAVSRHLRGIAQAAERTQPQSDVVHLTVVPTFASRYLVPRLSHFTQTNPDVQVRIDASPVLVDLEDSGFDLGVRYGSGNYPGLSMQRLFMETAAALCSPSYKGEHFAGEDERANWSGVRLLHELPPSDFWPSWLANADLTDVPRETGIYFSHGLLVLSAAIESQGVALQPLEFVQRELASGALVEADPRKLTTGQGYYLVWPRRELRPAVERCRDWIIHEADPLARTAGPASRGPARRSSTPTSPLS
jgi:LysR family transcriptional regulator, glycine cleavage system transcriptional activator